MTGGALSAVAGVLIQLFFAYFPGVKDWYDKQSGTTKGGVQIGLLALLAFGGFLPVCLGWFTKQLPLECSQVGVEQAIQNFIFALAANQGVYLTAVKPQKARETGANPVE